MLGDRHTPTAAIQVAAAFWAQSLPYSVFAIFDGFDDIEARIIVSLAQLGLPPGRLILVGLGDGGEIGVSLSLRAVAPCAGVLAIGVLPGLPPYAIVKAPRVKIRLIGYRARDPRHDNSLGDV